MSRDIDVFNISGAEYDRLMDEREILRQEAARAWREVDFIAKERTEHLEWRTKLANDLDECERHRDALAVALNKAEAELAEARELLRRVLSCGLNEEPHGVGFTPSKQERIAGDLATDISNALRKS